MKVFTVLLAVFMLFMTFSVCQDIEICEEKGRTELADTDDHKQDSAGLCTPFCHCARCPFSVILPEKIIRFNSEPDILKMYRIPANALLAGISMAVWQPPKCA